MKYRQSSLAEWLLDYKRLLLYVGSFLAVVGIQTVLYWWGMAALEGEPRSLLESLEVIVQSLTTTGYGQDAPWDSTFLLVLSILAQFTGVAYLFIAFPLFVGPWIRDAFDEQSVPDAVEGAEDHVIICGYSSLCSTLIKDLEAREQSYVILESDEDRARDLYEDGKTVVHGRTRSRDSLKDANVRSARAFVIGTAHDHPIETILSIGEFDLDLEIVCLVDDPEESRYLRYAGATTVLSPKHRLGKSVADKAQTVVSNTLVDGDESEPDVEIVEFPIREGSTLHGRSFTELDELEETGATVVGAWIRGEFVTAPSSEENVDENTVLVVAGTRSQLERVERITRTEGRSPDTGPVIVAGHGIVGTTAAGLLRKTGRQVTVVDRHSGEGVDVVGDATTIETLHEAAIEDAETIILALPDDELAIRSTLVAREANPDVEILVAADDADSTNSLYSAGADFVLSLPKVAGRMTTLALFDRSVLTLLERLRITRLDPGTLAGTQLENHEVRETGSVVVAVERNGDVIGEFDDGFTIEEGDELIVAGTDEAVTDFQRAVARTAR